MTDTPDLRRCSRCGRCFKSRRATDQHITNVHKGKGERVTVRRDREPSMADLVVEAIEAKAAGEPVDPWIKSIFKDYL